jgi:transposase
MQRTVKRYSNKINSGKWQQLCHIAELARDEKNFHLKYFNQDKNFLADKNERVRRDALVKEKYKPDTKLQARQWKMSEKAAYETVLKNWCGLAVKLKPMIRNHKKVWSDAALHYAYWLVYSEKRLAQLISADAPVPEDFEIPYKDQKQVRNYLRRVVRRDRGQRSIAKSDRSFELDANMYDVVERIGKDGKLTQFLSIMGLIPQKRIIIPLTGVTTIKGNIKIVLDFARQRAEVHIGFELRAPKVDDTKPVIALDAGSTEVFVDNLGYSYGLEFGETLKKVSDQMNVTGKGRNKAYVVRNLTSSKKKAHRITKNNLGRKKLNSRRRKSQIQIREQISHAIHQVVEDRDPSIIITENLDIRGKAYNKEMSRLVSHWMRGSLKERLGFLALLVSYHHKQVNPAYTSQMCPECWFVHKRNRAGDRFKCLNCGYRDHADWVAARNLITRYYDPDITLQTPRAVVKSILQGRFNDSLEKCGQGRHADALTVPVRTDGVSRPARAKRRSQIIHQNRDGTEMSCLLTF